MIDPMWWRVRHRCAPACAAAPGLPDTPPHIHSATLLPSGARQGGGVWLHLCSAPMQIKGPVSSYSAPMQITGLVLPLFCPNPATGASSAVSCSNANKGASFAFVLPHPGPGALVAGSWLGGVWDQAWLQTLTVTFCLGLGLGTCAEDFLASVSVLHFVPRTLRS